MKRFLFLFLFIFGATGCSQLSIVDLSIDSDAVICEYYKHYKSPLYSGNRVSYLLNELKRRNVSRERCIELTGSEGIYKFYKKEIIYPKDLIVKLDALKYYKRIPGGKMDDFNFYKALILFLYDERECILANLIEKRSKKFLIPVIDRDDNFSNVSSNVVVINSISCEDNFFKTFKSTQKFLNIDEVISIYIYNEKFYYFLTKSTERLG